MWTKFIKYHFFSNSTGDFLSDLLAVLWFVWHILTLKVSYVLWKINRQNLSITIHLLDNTLSNWKIQGISPICSKDKLKVIWYLQSTKLSMIYEISSFSINLPIDVIDNLQNLQELFLLIIYQLTSAFLINNFRLQKNRFCIGFKQGIFFKNRDLRRSR